MKKVIKMCWLLAMLCLATPKTGATPVDAASALSRTSQFVNSHAAGRMVPAGAELHLIHAEPSVTMADVSDYYVFTTGDGDAFVIIAGDDRAEPVLAYGEGTIDMTDMPCNLAGMLDHYKEQIDWLHAHPGAQVQQLPAMAQTVTVSPLLTSTWSQGEPYNNMCPYYKGKRCVTGCVATAMAQVMYYWKHPNDLPDLIGYSTMDGEIILPDLPPVTLDWDNMLDAYGFPFTYTQAQGDAVAVLMRYCGQASRMGYSPSGSGAVCEDQVVAMRMFGYNPATRLVHRYDYSAEEWRDMMVADLAQRHPILYAGFGDDGGHAFVVCGYNGSKFYIDWGWEGNWNGYFALDAFIGGGMDFNTNQQMITELYPFEFGVTIAPYDFEVDGIYYKKIDDGVKVTNRDESYGSYSGVVNIPSQVTSDGVTYTVTAIGNNAFRDCRNLTSVTLPSTVKTIGKYAFKSCSNLSHLVIPSSVKVIDYSAFQYCRRLTSLSLPASLEEIGYYAFYGCSGIPRVSIPGSVTSLGDGAFVNCSGLKTATIGNGVESISYRCFALCTGLTDVVISDGVKLIDESAFSDCRRLTTVTMGAGVDSLGYQAFYGCTSLKSLIMHPELPPFTAGDDCFSPVAYEQATVYVADEWIMDDYYWADVWTLFTHFAFMHDLPSTPDDVNGDGEVNIADINAVIDLILNGNEDARGDVNGDGEVNIADINAVIDLILDVD